MRVQLNMFSSSAATMWGIMLWLVMLLKPCNLFAEIGQKGSVSLNSLKHYFYHNSPVHVLEERVSLWEEYSDPLNKKEQTALTLAKALCLMYKGEVDSSFILIQSSELTEARFDSCLKLGLLSKLHYYSPRNLDPPLSRDNLPELTLKEQIEESAIGDFLILSYFLSKLKRFNLNHIEKSFFQTLSARTWSSPAAYEEYQGISLFIKFSEMSQRLSLEDAMASLQNREDEVANLKQGFYKMKMAWLLGRVFLKFKGHTKAKEYLKIAYNLSKTEGDHYWKGKTYAELMRIRWTARRKLTVRKILPGNPRIRHFELNETHRIKTVRCWVQDTNGIIYAGNGRNSSGLLRFDGETWSVVKGTEACDVHHIAVDRSNNLLIYDKDGFRYMMVKSGTDTATSIGQSTPDLGRQSEGNLLDMTNLELMAYGATTIDPFWAKIRTGGMGEARIFYDQGTLYQFKKARGIFKRKSSKWIVLPMSFQLSHMDVKGVHSISENEHWVVTLNGIFKFNDHSVGRITSDAESYLNYHGISTSTSLRDGNIAIGTRNGGLIILNKKGHIEQIVDKKMGLAGNAIASLFQDNVGNIWVGLGSSGRTDFSGIDLVEYPSTMSNYNGIFGLKNIFFSCQTTSGVYISDALRLRFLPNSTPNNPRQLHLQDWHENLFSPLDNIPFYPYSNLYTQNDTLYITNQKGTHITYRNRLIKTLPKIKTKLYGSGSSPYLFTINEKSQLIQLLLGYTHPKEQVVIDLDTIEVLDLIVCGKEVWLNTSDGLIRCNLNRRTTKWYKTGGYLGRQKFELKIYKSNPILTYYRYGKRRVFQYQPKQDSFILNAYLEGFPAAGWGSLPTYLRHRMGMLYRSGSNSGLGITGLAQEESFGFKVYNTAGHLLTMASGDSIWPAELMHLQCNSLFYNNSEQSWWCDASRYHASNGNRQLPEVNLLMARILHDSTLIEIKSFSKQVIKSGVRLMQLTFASPITNVASKTYYSYRLIGENDRWSSWTENNSAEFYSLADGEYRFEVKAKTVYRQEGPAMSFSFSIPPPWYASTLAFFSYALFAILLFLISIRLYGARLRKQRSRLKALVTERTREIQHKNAELERKNLRIETLMTDTVHRAMGHMQLTRNLLEMQSRQLDHTGAKTALDETKRRIGILEQLQRMLLQIRTGNKPVSCKKLLQDISQSLHNAYRSNDTLFTLEMELDDSLIHPEYAAYLGLLIGEIQINAYKHAFNGPEAGLLKIVFKIDSVNSKWHITISDNGPGILGNNEPSRIASFGQKLILAFVEQLNGCLEVRENNGTVFQITFPDLSQTAI